MEVTEQKLVALTSTLLMDYLRWLMRNDINFRDESVANLRYFCEQWLKENVKEFRRQDVLVEKG